MVYIQQHIGLFFKNLLNPSVSERRATGLLRPGPGALRAAPVSALIASMASRLVPVSQLLVGLLKEPDTSAKI